VAEPHRLHVAAGEEIAHPFPGLALAAASLLLLPGEAVGLGLEEPIGGARSGIAGGLGGGGWRPALTGHVGLPRTARARPRARRSAGGCRRARGRLLPHARCAFRAS